MVSVVPALLWVFVPLVVEVKGDLGIQSNPEVVVHDTFLGIAVPDTHRHTEVTVRAPGRTDSHYAGTELQSAASHVVRVAAERVCVD